MKTNWIYSCEYETKRLIETAYQVANGFYKSKGFIVLDRAVEDCIYFPYLGYKKISKFWKRVFNIKYNSFPIKVHDKKLYTVLLEKINKKYKEVPDVKKTQRLWEVIGEDIVSVLLELLNLGKGSIKEINIFITNFGTSITFEPINKLPAKINLYLRYDQGIKELVYGLILALTRKKISKDYLGGWEESQFLADWLINDSKLKHILESIGVTYEFSSKYRDSKKLQNKALILESDKYYKKLGLEGDFRFSLDKKKVIVNDTELVNITKREREMFELLISKRATPVSYDEFSNILFKDDDDFSLYAISKAVERLRKKLDLNGISPAFIQTVRNKGYLLRN